MEKQSNSNPQANKEQRMNRPLFGLILGAAIGFLDGGTAKFTSPEPQYQEALLSIMLGSSFKGLLGGLITGFVTRKTNSLARGALVGLGISLVLATIIAKMNADYYQDMSLYWKIIAPGMLTGLIVGYSTVRYGVPAGGSSAGRNA
jgi:LytS/YehU family sensor histidine kinase